MASGFAILDIKGIPGGRREEIKAAVIAGCQHLTGGYEAWIAPARRPPAHTLRVIGPCGFYREVCFTGRESEAEVTEKTRQALKISIAISAGA